MIAKNAIKLPACQPCITNCVTASDFSRERFRHDKPEALGEPLRVYLYTQQVDVNYFGELHAEWQQHESFCPNRMDRV
jgi:hypothetical protein